MPQTRSRAYKLFNGIPVEYPSANPSVVKISPRWLASATTYSPQQVAELCCVPAAFVAQTVGVTVACTPLIVQQVLDAAAGDDTPLWSLSYRRSLKTLTGVERECAMVKHSRNVISRRAVFGELRLLAQMRKCPVCRAVDTPRRMRTRVTLAQDTQVVTEQCLVCYDEVDLLKQEVCFFCREGHWCCTTCADKLPRAIDSLTPCEVRDHAIRFGFAMLPSVELPKMAQLVALWRRSRQRVALRNTRMAPVTATVSAP